MASQTSSPLQTIAFVSLGCPKNLVDSEKMLGLLAEDGLIPVSDPSEADAIVVNTCGFLEAAKEESIAEIQQALAYKQEGVCQRVIVAGCLVQRHRAKILNWCPDIDAMIGVFDRDRIVRAVRGDSPAALRAKSQGNTPLPVYSSIASNATLAQQDRGLHETGYFESDAARLRLTPRHYAYLRISEGCNQNCTFCTIPSIRGKMRSKPPQAILAEAAELFTDGAFELNLIGQDTTSYGQDIGYEPGLVGLLESLNQSAAEQGGGWLRLMYAYPSCFTDEMIDAIARLPHVLKYIDMPLQHICDPVLDQMRRKTSRSLIETLLEKLRTRVPGIALRTTFISGFPGETRAQHAQLVQFIKDFQFDAMGVFPYSPEPGTPAGTLHKTRGIDPHEIDERIEELMLAQQQVVFERNRTAAREKREVDVLIDAPAESDNTSQTDEKVWNRYMGRTYHQAPDVDSLTYVDTSQTPSPGEVLRCQIVDWEDYDLIARPVADLEKRTALPILQMPT